MARRNRIAPDERAIQELDDIRLRLETIFAVVATVVSALRGQGADDDALFARCLMRGALDPLGAQIERLSVYRPSCETSEHA